MIKDLITNWFSDNKVKISSPVLGAFIGAWILFNWKHFLLLFWGSGEIENRLEIFEKNIEFANLSIWLWPLLVAMAYAFVLPYLNVLSHKLLKKAEEWRHDEVVNIDILKAKKKAELNEELYKADPANAYLGRKLQAELKQKDADAEKARAVADREIAEAKEARIRQEKAEVVAKQEKLKEAEVIRKGEREQQAHDLATAKYRQELLDYNFPTLYLFLDILSKALREDDFHLSIGLMSDSIAASFGYDDVNSMLTDDAFSLANIECLTYVVYEEKTLFKRLKNAAAMHDESISEISLFNQLVATFEEVNKFSFISSSSMVDVAKNFTDDLGNFYDLVHDENVGSAIAESNANDFGVESVEFIDMASNNKGDYVANATVDIQGEISDDRPYSGHKIDAEIQLIYKPIIGRNGYAMPRIEVIRASLNLDY